MGKFQNWDFFSRDELPQPMSEMAINRIDDALKNNFGVMRTYDSP